MGFSLRPVVIALVVRRVSPCGIVRWLWIGPWLLRMWLLRIVVRPPPSRVCRLAIVVAGRWLMRRLLVLTRVWCAVWRLLRWRTVWRLLWWRAIAGVWL